ncbi:MAG: winged helix-turn-helix domain-containing protein [Phycisphaerales bacterium]
MKKAEIKVNGLYKMKIGKNIIGVRIMSQNPEGHWIGNNLKTNNNVIIKSANQLIGVYRAKKAKAQDENKAADPAKDITTEKECNTTRPGGLSGAVKVLQEAGEPLNCQEMVKQMLEKGYWKTDGKTPAATLHSAISREIKEKGADARFRKVEIGKFDIIK